MTVRLARVKALKTLADPEILRPISWFILTAPAVIVSDSVTERCRQAVRLLEQDRQQGHPWPPVRHSVTRRWQCGSPRLWRPQASMDDMPISDLLETPSQSILQELELFIIFFCIILLLRVKTDYDVRWKFMRARRLQMLPISRQL